jgi:hypothetical protein
MAMLYLISRAYSAELTSAPYARIFIAGEMIPGDYATLRTVIPGTNPTTVVAIELSGGGGNVLEAIKIGISFVHLIYTRTLPQIQK